MVDRHAAESWTGLARNTHIDVQSLDAIQSHSRIQSGQEATPEEFGLDVEQDMLKAIVGKPVDESLGKRMTGTDSLSVSVRMDLSDLPALLQKYRDNFEIDLTETNHEWVNNISIVRNAELIATLETMLIEKLNSGDVSDVWLAIPEIIDWTHVAGFEFDRGKGETRTDITLEGFIGTLDDGPIDLATLKSRRVHCVDADHNRTFRSWSAFRCLYAEIDLAKRKYILNDSKWFSVADDFVARTDKHFAGIPASKLKLPAYAGGGEGKYNSEVATAEPGTYALLDQNLVTHGGSRGQIEVCDLLHVDRHLIHVKLYGKSSVLSHLIAQGFVSGQLIQIDGDFRKKVIAKLSPPFSKLLHEANRPKPNEFTVVYAVISSGAGKLHLPFFSRVNLNNTAKLLAGLGYNVELLKIDVDEGFAKTVKAAPHKRRKTKKTA